MTIRQTKDHRMQRQVEESPSETNSTTAQLDGVSRYAMYLLSQIS
jgi:hypothetical protein